MLLVWVALLFAASMSVSQVAAQAPGAPNCALFTSMSEEHGKKAQAIEQAAAEQAKTLTAQAAKTNADIAARAAKSEWEMAALSREAARKCLTDFLSPDQTTTAAPATAAPVRKPVKQTVNQQPVKQAQPARKTRSVQQQRFQRQDPINVPLSHPQRPFQPVLPGLIELGIGIGLGGYR